MNPADLVRAALRHAEDHARLMAGSIVLYAGTNVASPAVEAALANGMGTMPAMGRPWAKDQPGTGPISALEQQVEHQVCALFGGNWAEVRLPNATLANLALYRCFCRPTAPLMANARQDLGHASHVAEGTPGLLGIPVVTTPFLPDGITVDEDAAIAVLERSRPGLLMLGATLVLDGRYPERLVARARALGTVVAYDASHVAGLIAGGAMRSPFDVGVQLVTASTYKSFGGPPGGVIIGTDAAQADAVRPVVCPGLTSNYDAGRLVALALACADARAFMADYARRMVRTADVLHRCLGAEGIDLLPRRTGTGTHQVMLPLGDEARARVAMADLERCHILAGTQRVPGAPGRFGLRLGTQVIARRLYDDQAVAGLAGLIRSVLVEGSSDRVAEGAAALAAAFPTVSFCLPPIPLPHEAAP